MQCYRKNNRKTKYTKDGKRITSLGRPKGKKDKKRRKRPGYYQRGSEKTNQITSFLMIFVVFIRLFPSIIPFIDTFFIHNIFLFIFNKICPNPSIMSALTKIT
jgi:hypothetical protein